MDMWSARCVEEALFGEANDEDDGEIGDLEVVSILRRCVFCKLSSPPFRRVVQVLNTWLEVLHVDDQYHQKQSPSFDILPATDANTLTMQQGFHSAHNAIFLMVCRLLFQRRAGKPRVFVQVNVVP